MMAAAPSAAGGGRRWTAMDSSGARGEAAGAGCVGGVGRANCGAALGGARLWRWPRSRLVVDAGSGRGRVARPGAARRAGSMVRRRGGAARLLGGRRLAAAAAGGAPRAARSRELAAGLA